MKNEPCIRLGMRIRPKISEKPDESRNSRLPSATLFTARVSHRLIVRLPVEPKPEVHTISVLDLWHLRILHRNTFWQPTSLTSFILGHSRRIRRPFVGRRHNLRFRSRPQRQRRMDSLCQLLTMCRGLFDGRLRESNSSSSMKG